MKSITKIILSTTLFAIAAFSLFIPLPVEAQSGLQQGINAAQGDGVPTDLFGAGGIVTTVTNVLLFIAGVLAVIMIIIGGLRYATSGGNSSSVTAAKNTILYAIVGLIVAFLAFAAVNFVLSALSGNIGTGGGTNV